MKMFSPAFLVVFLCAGISLYSHAQDTSASLVTIENDYFSIGVNSNSGVIESLVVKSLSIELIEEQRLAANFRIGLPLPEYGANYIDGEKQHVASVKASKKQIDVRFEAMTSERGEYPIELNYSIMLDGDTIKFRAKLTNPTEYPIAEFWFPRIGGWTNFGKSGMPMTAIPHYTSCGHSTPLFQWFPGGRGLGAEAAEFSTSYPGMVMPWWDLYNAEMDRGLYMGYHDITFRLSTWHTYLYPTTSGRPDRTWMTPEEAGGAPVGLVFSHVRYPYIKSGETLESGEFILRLHQGDWHKASLGYREWFLEHFPFDKSDSWLRKESAWFTSILYQPEDKIIADYKTYDQWTQDAHACGIHCNELIGWDKGGIERDYPAYVPEEKLGGWQGFLELMHSINGHGDKVLVFANYNVMDCNTEWYRNELQAYTHQDTFGKTPNWMAWGESTLTARLGLSVRRHMLASVVPEFEKILEKQFVEIAKSGANGLQIDKVVAGSALDFNPRNTLKPDVALCEGLVQAMGRAREACRAVNPDFCFASEASQDRLIPFVDVFYRNAAGNDIAPLRYVFPEWTACQHVSAPLDFNGVNGAVLTGAVICMEPDSYQNTLGNPQYRTIGGYIKEVQRLRTELADIVFLGKYYDTMDARIKEVTAGQGEPSPKYVPANAAALPYRVHGHCKTDQRAIAVSNTSANDRLYFWEFLTGNVTEADLYEPFQPVRTVKNGEPVSIKGQTVQILVEHPAPLPETLKFSMKCGVQGNEVIQAAKGFGVQVEQGFLSAWGPHWLPPVYHCRAHETELRIRLDVPKKSAGKLRLFVIDPDRFYGGRREEINVDGVSLGAIENFSEGRWLEYDVPKSATKDGSVVIQALNLKKEGNAVLSLIEWLNAK
ncbi:MAG TPA: DUF6259 domain-containing protein [Candidatus Hydrogenedentes bacterium]|nr:DUF6259 domain-containing protein [Candidatus Hydrogenedentota bacterium]